MNARDGEETRRPRWRRGVGVVVVAGLVVAAGLAGGVAAGLAVIGPGEGSVGGVREDALDSELSGAP